MTDNHPDYGRLTASIGRNRDPILAVLKDLLPARGLVLEIGSGTGGHATYFAPRFPDLVWQPSDATDEFFDDIAQWTGEIGAGNIRPPLILDAASAAWPIAEADAIFCANVIHIAPWAVAEGIVAGAGRILNAGGRLILDGPYKVGGRHTAPSNEAFDGELRQRNPAWGVRDLDDVIAEAAKHGLTQDRVIDMPANNKTVVFENA